MSRSAAWQVVAVRPDGSQVLGDPSDMPWDQDDLRSGGPVVAFFEPPSTLVMAQALPGITGGWWEAEEGDEPDERAVRLLAERLGEIESAPTPSQPKDE